MTQASQAFHRNAAKPDGLADACIPCARAYYRRWYASNRDRWRTHVHAYRLDTLDARRAYDRERSRNRSRRIKRQVYEQRRRARKLGVRNDLTQQQWREILQDNAYTCTWCARADVPMTMDHITPLAIGGEHTAENIVPACRHCNSRKGARLEWEN